MNDVDPPSRTPAVTGVELGVGLSMAFAALAFFLHSNATWSLHSLWQFIPQSVQTEECSTSQNRRRSYITDNTVHFMFCRRSPQTSCVSCQAKTIALVSHERQRWGGGEVAVVLTADSIMQTSSQNTQHRKPQDTFLE